LSRNFGENLERGEIRGNREKYFRKERNSGREVSTRTSFTASTFPGNVLLENAREKETIGIRKWVGRSKGFETHLKMQPPGALHFN